LAYYGDQYEIYKQISFIGDTTYTFSSKMKDVAKLFMAGQNGEKQ
jgi:hypothetical protein